VGYKGKKAQKTLNTSFYIWYIGDKKMKQVRVQNVTYYIESEDELIDLAHRLVKEGYSVSQIAQFLGVTERKVKKMMEDCW